MLIALAGLCTACAWTNRPPEGIPVPRTRLLFDGESLSGWKVVGEQDFPGRGDVRVADGAIRLGAGDPFTGIVWEGEFPKELFEVELEAMRISGNDIFCGLTVPVGDSHVTLVLGGWGNSLAGLSCIDGFNASQNETTTPISFENGRWYKVRLRVTDRAIEAELDGKRLFRTRRENKRFSIYRQLEPLRPAGFFSWRTEAALRGIKLTSIEPAAEESEEP